MPATRATLFRRALTVAVLGAGCTTTTTITLTTSVITSVTVDPAVFLGGVPCSALPGGMQSYVATVTDWGSADPSVPANPANCVPGGGAGGPPVPCPYPFTLASSVATPCSQPIDFRFVVVGHIYTAEVDGYQVAPTELMPVGGASSGSRDMLGPDNQIAVPRWTTSCGGIGSNRTIALDDQQSTVQPCLPMNDKVGAGPPSVVLDPNLTLGAGTCASAGVASFAITPSDASLPVATIGCGIGPWTYTAGVRAGTGYTFRVDALDGGGTLLESASCNAVAETGLAVQAHCDPLTENGVMLIQMAALPGMPGLVAKAGLHCPSPVPPEPPAVLDTYTVSLSSGGPAPAVPIQGGPYACDANARIGPLLPSNQLVDAQVTGVDPSGKVVLRAVCGALIQPGQVSTAFCSVSTP